MHLGDGREVAVNGRNVQNQCFYRSAGQCAAACRRLTTPLILIFVIRAIRLIGQLSFRWSTYGRPGAGVGTGAQTPTPCPTEGARGRAGLQSVTPQD